MKKLLFFMLVGLFPMTTSAQLIEQILGVADVCPNCSGNGCSSCNNTGRRDRSGEAFMRGFREGLRMSENAVPDGFHKKTYENGTYEGYFKDGTRNGQGTYTCNDGEKYKGEWKDGKKHGKGILVSANNYKYKGDFANDEMHGKGILVTPEGIWYEGEFAANMMHGVGTLYIPAEKKYKKAVFEMNQPIQLLEEGTYNPAVKTPFPKSAKRGTSNRSNRK